MRSSVIRSSNATGTQLSLVSTARARNFLANSENGIAPFFPGDLGMSSSLILASASWQVYRFFKSLDWPQLDPAPSAVGHGHGP